MDVTFEELFEEFKQMDDQDKSKAIIDFLKGNIYALQNLNKQIGNDLDVKDINQITNGDSNDYLDVIYQLLHVMTEQVEMFSEKVANDFYEDEQ